MIKATNVTMKFDDFTALDNLCCNIPKGSIYGLVGSNGAGKSTLMSVLFGLYQPEKGEIRKNGEVVKINNPNDATALGIGMVHQHFKLVDVFSVLDNIILGAEPVNGAVVNRKEARKKVLELSAGDSIYFKPSIPHGQIALEGNAKFLTIIDKE